MGDALKLAFGTLTVLRVPAPGRVDAAVGGRAMTLAPLVGLVLGLIAAGAGLVADALELNAFLIAVVVVATFALLTRALHLDGLADTADGLGSGRQGAEALEVMKRSDIGPFGVVTLLFVVLVELGALTQVWQVDQAVGAASVVVAAVGSRAVLPLLCRSGVPSARSTGLGAAVAGTVRSGPLVATIAASLALIAVIGKVGWSAVERSYVAAVDLDDPYLLAVTDGGSPLSNGVIDGAWESLVAAAAALAIVAVLVQRPVRRFGGATGDVLGAGVELTFAATLLALAALV